MKKLIAILAVMMVLAGAVFANTGDKISLQSTVSKVTPNFKIYLGSEAGTKTIAITEDISEENVERTFTVKQIGSLDKNEGVKEYSKYKGAFTLTVAIDAFRNTTLNAASTTYAITTATGGAGYTVSNVARLTIGNGTAGNAQSAISEDTHSATFKVSYNGQKVTDENAGTIATIVALWTADENLPMEGDGSVYTADITLTYTAQ